MSRVTPSPADVERCWLEENIGDIDPRDMPALEESLAELLAEVRAEALAWADEDQPLPEDDAITAAHPAYSDKHHDLYLEAMRMVGAKRSKGALVDLVCWLLVRAVEARAEERRFARYHPSGEGECTCGAQANLLCPHCVDGVAYLARAEAFEEAARECVALADGWASGVAEMCAESIRARAKVRARRVAQCAGGDPVRRALAARALRPRRLVVPGGAHVAVRQGETDDRASCAEGVREMSKTVIDREAEMVRRATLAAAIEHYLCFQRTTTDHLGYVRLPVQMPDDEVVIVELRWRAVPPGFNNGDDLKGSP